MEGNAMLPKNSFRFGKSVLNSPLQNAIVSMFLFALCALSFPAPARANEGGTLFPTASQHLQFYSQPSRTFVTDHPATAPRWTLLPNASLEAIAPAIPSFQPFAESARPARLETYASLLPVRGFPLPKAALPPSPSRAGRGRWLALGIGGLAVTAAGAATYVRK
jgi:hypothetical protein